MPDSIPCRCWRGSRPQRARKGRSAFSWYGDRRQAVQWRRIGRSTLGGEMIFAVCPVLRGNKAGPWVPFRRGNLYPVR